MSLSIQPQAAAVAGESPSRIAQGEPHKPRQAAIAWQPAARVHIQTTSGSTLEVTGYIALRGKFADALRTPGLNRAALLQRLVPAAPAADLAWTAFCHLHTEAKDVCALLQAALARRAQGINILFYDVTGAGKTALARDISARLDVPLHMAAFADSDGDSLSGRERAEAFALAQRRIAPGTGLVLFDELTKLCRAPAAATAKQTCPSTGSTTNWDTTGPPAIYICNDLEALDPAYLRRFGYAIHFKPPGPPCASGSSRPPWAIPMC